MTCVESCEAASEKINGISTAGFHITLKDSVLFPEGGGQVCYVCIVMLSLVSLN